MPGVRQDVAYALRQMRNAPGFTAAALLTIAIGIGANTAVFSVVDAVLLRKLPYRDQDRLTAVTTFLPKQNSNVVLDALAQTWRSGNSSFEAMAAWRGGGAVLQGAGDPVRLRLARVTSDFLPMLGVNATPMEPGSVLLTHALWKTRFGSDPALTGKAVLLDDEPHLVAGILPAGFEFPSNAPIDALVPMDDPPESFQGRRAILVVEVIARLKPEVTPEMAARDLALVTDRAAEKFPPGYKRMHENAVPRVIPLVQHLAGDTREVLRVFLGAVALLLLIACANVANMLLTRTSARAKEVSLRLAIGADQSRLVRQLLTESLVLAAGGAVLGIAFAAAGITALRALAPASAPGIANTAWNIPVLLFTIAVTVGSGLLFGIAPLASIRHAHPANALGVQANTPARFGSRIDAALVATEIALAVMLLTGAGLLTRSFIKLTTLDPGFDPKRLLVARVQLPPIRYEKPEQRRLYFDSLLARVRALPGVSSAAAAAVLPYQGFMMSAGISIVGSTADVAKPQSAIDIATPDYFRTLGTAILAGREFNDRDQPGSPPVAIVNQAFVHRFFPGGSAIGKRVKFDETAGVEIVGVVTDVRQRGLGAVPEPCLYRPAAQDPSSIMALAIRARANPLDLAAPLREIVRSLDQTVLLDNVNSMEQNMERLTAAQRFNMTVLGVFALAGLLLAATGVYGVLSYTVSRRRHEMGVRLALGATPGDVIRLVLRRALAMTAAGAIAGIVGALGMMRSLGSMLFGVTPADPVTLAAVIGLVTAIALLAAYWPSRRAASVNPRESLMSQ
ncbi:MAG: ABC transporter permease [Bryobacteraceae bacterium]